MFTAIPLPVAATLAPAMKFVPVSVTFTAVPCTPLFGETEVRVGPFPAAVTVNDTMLLVPALVATVVLCGPIAALAEIINVAVICVGLTTTILVCLSPPPCRPTLDPEVKLVPVSVTSTDVPSAPLEGAIDASVGTPLAVFTVNGTVPLVPAVVATDTLRAPAVAPAAIVSVAVI